MGSLAGVKALGVLRSGSRQAPAGWLCVKGKSLKVSGLRFPGQLNEEADSVILVSLQVAGPQGYLLHSYLVPVLC